MKKTISLLFTLIISITLTAQPSPGEPQQKPVILTGATIHTGNGQVIENGVLRFADGKITHVGTATEVATDGLSGEKVDVSGQHVYPGFICANSVIGLVEVGAVRASRDYDEVGSINPNVRSLIAYNTDSKITPTVRSNGILMVQVTPRGGLISGNSSIAHLDAWNWEDAAYKKDDGIHLNWPQHFRKTGWWGNPGPTKENKKLDEQIEKLTEFIEEARAYSQLQPKEKNLRLEAMKGVFSGEKGLFIHANSAKEITEAVLFAREHGVKKPVIVGGMESWRVTDLLKEHEIPVVLNRVHELPDYPHDPIDIPFTTPKKLRDAGILFCLNYQGGMEAMGTRNLPFTAGTAAAYGLSKEEALASITLNAAKILGVDESTGSLETGKDATLFISHGDALDMRTNRLVAAYIQGRQLDLTSRQKELYLKFKEKYAEQ